MPVSFFTKESLFPSCQRSWNIFSIISLFHSWVCLLYERQGIEWKEGMNFGSQVCFASCMTVTELFNLSTPTWSYLQMRIIISTLQGCCQNLKCLAIISKIQAPMTWTCFLAEGFLLVQLLEKQGNFLLFWMLLNLNALLTCMETIWIIFLLYITIGLILVILSMVSYPSILVFLEYILSGFCFSCNALLNLIYPYFINT